MSDAVLRIFFISAMASMFTAGVFGVLSFVTFDRLLRQVWEVSEDAWVRLGRPCGFFWVPPGTGGVTKASLVRSGLYGQWTSEGAELFAGSAEGLGRLRRYNRIAGWCYAVGVLLLVSAVAMIFVG